MKINEIIVEAIDQKDANDVYNALIADGDNLTAKYFQQTRNNPKYNNIDSAMRAAERLASADERNRTAQQKPSTPVVNAPQPTINKPAPAPKKTERDPSDYSDSFYGNRYTGSLGRGASLGDVDLDIDFDQSGLQTIGKTIGAVKAAAKPFSNLATAFKAGMNKAPGKR
jgi:hypothetical protein